MFSMVFLESNQGVFSKKIPLKLSKKKFKIRSKNRELKYGIQKMMLRLR